MSILTSKLRRDLRRSRAQFIAITVTIFLGITLFGATFDAYRSLAASYQQMYQDLGFPDFWIAGGDTTATAGEVAALDGVDRVTTRSQADVPLRPIPDHLLFGRIVGTPDPASGIGDLLILNGRSPDPGADEVVLERHAADHFSVVPGDTIQVAGPEGWRSLTVAGIAASSEYLWPSPSRQEIISSLDDFAVVFASDAIVREVAAASATTQVLITYEEGADAAALDAALTAIAVDNGAVDFYTRTDQPSNSALQTDVEGFGELSFMFPALFLTAAGIGTWVMLTRLVMTQMPIIGILMANGMRRRTIFRHYVGYGLVIGLVGAIPGVVAGALLAWLIAGVYTDAISVPLTVVRIDATTPLIGIAFGLVTGLLAAIFPAWRAARRSPAEAMRGVHPIGTAKHTVLERLIPPLRRLSATGSMVLRGISRNIRRTATTITGVVLSLTLILVSWGMIDTVDGLLVRQFDRIEGSDARVVLDRYPDTDLLSDITSVDGVSAVEPTLSVPVTVEAGNARYSTDLVAFVPNTTMHVFLGPDGEIPLTNDGVLLGDDMAGLLGIDVGDTVTLVPATGTATAPLRVAGFVDEPLGTYAYASLDLLAESGATGAAPPGVVPGAAVRFEESADPSAMRSALQEVDGVLAVTGTRAFEETLRSFLGLFYAFVGVMLVFGGLLAFAIIFNTMSVNLAERTVEVATLKASGMTDRRYARLLTAENLLVTMIGLGPGLILGYVVAAEFMAAYSNDQFTFDLMMRPTTLVFSSLAIVIVTLLSQVPGIRSIRRLDVAKVVRERAV